MKNSKLIVALFATGILGSFNTLNAQKGLQLGIEGSPQFSWLVNADDINDSKFDDLNAFNGAFGISTQYGFTEKFGVGLNVLYSYQGDKYVWRGLERYKTLQYIKVPVMFTVHLHSVNNEALVFTGKVGPQLNILTDAKLLDQDGNRILSNYKNAFAPVDLSLMLSAGIGYMLTDNIVLDAALRYDAGITNAEDSDFPSNIHNPFESKQSGSRAMTSNMTLGLTVGLRYNFY